ncbi:FAD binding domain-containing protein [Lutispora saccharofermentans]|uniref:Xanthine dehydrogenase family protein subunit M n=1 Tax=Lutispora saccharofermentans TaxID=3024236 RepID=A0ABT1NDR3_9FIRM|nr:xanthine dehydrogenase family protein subunit M [Lutispora saccharofermentans]MCQ1529378.1 xanthine dehydrogenase family protein subunit M [Lutispora saccharofermentans]
MYGTLEYLCPTSLQELFQLMESYKDEAAIYAGGTDLLVLLRSGKVSFKYLIDVKKIPELNGINETEKVISIGSVSRFIDIQNSLLVNRWAKALSQASNQVGSVQIRFKGTLGGNIKTASPAGDGLNAAWALDAQIGLLSVNGERILPLTEFILAPRKTVILPGEVIARIYIPKREWSYQKFFKVGRRNALAISVVNGAVALEVDKNGIIKDSRISLGSVAPTPLRITKAEQLLMGKELHELALEELARIVQESVSPISDIRAGAEYRAYMAGVLVKKQIVEFLEEFVK